MQILLTVDVHHRQISNGDTGAFSDAFDFLGVLGGEEFVVGILHSILNQRDQPIPRNDGAHHFDGVDDFFHSRAIGSEDIFVPLLRGQIEVDSEPRDFCGLTRI